MYREQILSQIGNILAVIDLDKAASIYPIVISIDPFLGFMISYRAPAFSSDGWFMKSNGGQS